jgi:hypothetical protein
MGSKPKNLSRGPSKPSLENLRDYIAVQVSLLPFGTVHTAPEVIHGHRNFPKFTQERVKCVNVPVRPFEKATPKRR